MAQPKKYFGKYEFCNDGILHAFDPRKVVYDNLNGGGQISLLDLHLRIVRERNSKSVYIIDSSGNILDKHGEIDLPYHKNSLRSKKK